MNKSKLTSCIRRITTLLFTMIIAFNPHSVMASEESKALYPAAPGTYRHWLGGTTETAKIGKVDETGCNTSWLFDDNIYVTSTYNPTNRQSFALDIHSSLPQPIEVET